jgi:mannose-6-phosphate isomerase
MAEDGVAEVVPKPWGEERIVFVGAYVVKTLFMREGERCSLQYHERKHETVVVLNGELRVIYGPSPDELFEVVLTAGDHLILEPHTIHRMCALTDTTYLEASTPDLQDVVRLQDDYGRST